MRVAVLVDTFPRWSERFIARELSCLLRAGLDLTIFCLRAGELPEPDGDWAGLLERRVVLPACILGAGRLRAATPESARRQALAREVLGLRHRSRIACAQKFAELLREGKFQHVYAHFASLPSTLAWLAAGEAKLPFSMSLHARDVFVDAELLAEKFRDSAAVFVCNERARQHLLAMPELAGDAKKLVLVRHGLPLQQFPFTRRHAEKTVGILAAGRFVPKKGFATLLDALSRPELKGKDFHATLLGEGPERKKLAALIRRHGLRDQVSLVNPLSGQRLRDAFNAAGLLVAPYLTAPDGDMDGVPNVILEAFALGLPVIGTDAGGLSEILTDDTATQMAQGDAAALSSAIAKFIADPKLANSKTDAARRLIEREYDVEKNSTAIFSSLTKGFVAAHERTATR